MWEHHQNILLPALSQQVTDVVDEIVKTALKTKIKAPDLKGYTVTVA